MPILVRREEMPSVESVIVDDKPHNLGILKDFRSHRYLRNFLSPDLKLSMSWVHLDPDEVLEPHVHPVDSMIIVCHGTGLSLGDLKAELHDGDIFMVPAGHAHGFKGTGPRGFWALSVQFETRSLYENLDDPLVNFVTDGDRRGREDTRGARPGPSLTARQEPGRSSAAPARAEESRDHAALERLLAENRRHAERWRNHRIFALMAAGRFDNPAIRNKFLDCLQVWSNQFQRVVMARAIFSDDSAFRALAEDHLIEEFGHHRLLQQDRDNPQPVWDAVLEASSEWFVAKILSLDNAERTVLVHLVLETAAIIAYPLLGRVLPKRQKGTTHYAVHSDGTVDEHHMEMGVDLLRRTRIANLERLRDVLNQGWEMMNTMFDRMTTLSLAAGTDARMA